MTTAWGMFSRVTPTSEGTRIGRVVRLHFANPWRTIVLPWIILGAIAAGNLAIWAIIYASSTRASDREDVTDGSQFNGSVAYIFVYMLVVAIQAINITFPFALGYGVTRRDYYLGTALSFVILSAMLSVGLTLIGLFERLTNGWGIGVRMFTAVFFGENWAQDLYTFFVVMLFVFFIGSLLGAVFVRWGSTGLTFLLIGLGALVIGALAVVALTNNWGAVNSFFASAGRIGTLSWALLLPAMAGVAAFFVLRRATPRG